MEKREKQKHDESQKMICVLKQCSLTLYIM